MVYNLMFEGFKLKLVKELTNLLPELLIFHNTGNGWLVVYCASSFIDVDLRDIYHRRGREVDFVGLVKEEIVEPLNKVKDLSISSFVLKSMRDDLYVKMCPKSYEEWESGDNITFELVDTKYSDAVRNQYGALIVMKFNSVIVPLKKAWLGEDINITELYEIGLGNLCRIENLVVKRGRHFYSVENTDALGFSKIMTLDLSLIPEYNGFAMIGPLSQNSSIASSDEYLNTALGVLTSEYELINHFHTHFDENNTLCCSKGMIMFYEEYF